MRKGKGSIGIVGLGLIGGSLGLDLRALGWTVQGLVHRRSAPVRRALERGLVDAVSTDPACLSGCDLVILALPIPALLNPSRLLVRAAAPTAVVTDVGSVKQPVLEVWGRLHPRFVASHPMAGTASAGVEAGQMGLFRGRPWIATPTAAPIQHALELVRQVAEELGSQWFAASAEQHDQAVALISHMPVLVSAALLRTAGEERDPRDSSVGSGAGFQRVCRHHAGWWGKPRSRGTAMASSNTVAVRKALAAYRWSLEQLEDAVLRELGATGQELKRTQALRPEYLDTTVLFRACSSLPRSASSWRQTLRADRLTPAVPSPG